MTSGSRVQDTTPLPPPGSRATLIRADGDAWPVRVLERQDSTLTLVPLFDLDERSRNAGPEIVALDAITHWGLLRLEGEATTPGPDLICLRVSRVTDVLQRRGLARVAVSRPVLIVGDAFNPAISTYTIDISGNGMLLAGPENLREASYIRFSLRFDPEQPKLEGLGRVSRIDAGRPAISFRELPEADRERLIHFIFEHQRIARSATRDLRA